MVVLIVFILGYGVVSNSILKPVANTEPYYGLQMIKNIVWKPYFSIYGELFVDRDRENVSK